MKAKKKNLLDIVTRLIVIIMVCLFAWLPFRWFTQKVLVDRLHVSNAFINFVLDKKVSGLPDGVSSPGHVGVNWQSLYPFEKTYNTNSANEKQNEAEPEKIALPILTDLKTKYENLTEKKEKLADSIPDKVPSSYTFNQAGALYNHVLGWEIPVKGGSNNVVSLGDGYYSALTTSKQDPTKTVDSVTSFRDFLAEQNTPLLYVAAPRKITKDDTKISGVLDFSVQNTDALLQGLSGFNVDTLDMRIAIAEKYDNPHEAFFKTDIHWKPQTALLAAGETAKYLNEHYGFSIDLSLFDEDQFEQEVYPDRLLGSEGRKLTTAVADPEDFILFYPKNETEFTINIANRKVNKTGGFEIFYDYAQVLGNIEYYDRMAYEAYLYSGNPLTEIDNHANTDGKKVLMLCDSFGRTFAPFFARGVSRLEVIDLRQFSGSLETYVKRMGPYDAVIIVYNPGAINASTLIDFR